VPRRAGLGDTIHARMRRNVPQAMQSLSDVEGGMLAIFFCPKRHFHVATLPVKRAQIPRIACLGVQRFIAAIATPADITAAPPARWHHFLTPSRRINPEAVDAVRA